MLACIFPYACIRVSLWYNAYVLMHASVSPYDTMHVSLCFCHVSLCYQASALMLACVCPHTQMRLSLCSSTCWKQYLRRHRVRQRRSSVYNNKTTGRWRGVRRARGRRGGEEEIPWQEKQKEKKEKRMSLCMHDWVLMLLWCVLMVEWFCPYAHLLVSTYLQTCVPILDGKENEGGKKDDEDDNDDQDEEQVFPHAHVLVSVCF